jgi:hypothetical protein
MISAVNWEARCRCPSSKTRCSFSPALRPRRGPLSENRSLNVLTSAAMQGNFSYIGTDGATRSVNVQQVASATPGFSNRVDPTVPGVLNAMSGFAAKGTTIPNTSNPNFQTLQWSQKADSTTLYPTARVANQIHPKLAWHGAWNLRRQHNLGRPTYPENTVKADAYKITTYVASNALDWTITPTMLNTFNFGVQSNVELF